MQSNVCTMGLFHAALSMWAFTIFADGSSATEQGQTSPACNASDGLCRIPPTAIAKVSEVGLLDLVPAPGPGGSMVELDEDAMVNGGSRHVGAKHADLLEAWVSGKYISTQDDKVYDWPLSPMAVRVAGIGALNEPGGSKSTLGKPTLTRASLVLERFAMLLARLDWGLAASFRLILLHMARHAVK